MGGRGVHSLSGLNSERRNRKQQDKEVSEDLRGAIGSLGKPATVEEAMVRANEDIKTGNEAFLDNCYNVVVAYELQRRGYDVKAKGVNNSLNLGETIYPYGKNNGYMTSRWAGAFKNGKFEHVGSDNKETTANNLVKKIKSYGNGSRGAIQFDVVGREKGHVLNFENRGGKVSIVDAQENVKYNVKDIMKVAVTKTVNVIRMDNLRISDKAKNSVRKRK